MAKLKIDIKVMKHANQRRKEDVIKEAVDGLPLKQKIAVMQCFKKCKKKGERYTKEWVLECLLMRIKSRALYTHIRTNNILSLPSLQTMNKYIRGIGAEFGLSEDVLRALDMKLNALKKSKEDRHGALIVDEMSLKEHVDLDRTKWKMLGLIDLGDDIDSGNTSTVADHGMVIYFRPFVDVWGQAVGVYSSRTAVPGKQLAKLLMSVIMKLEEFHLFVDCIVCDGATNNRLMWKEFGIGLVEGIISNSANHPCDESRRLYFISDVPHLFKCLRNNWLSSGKFEIGGHEVLVSVVKMILKLDSNPALCALRCVPKLSSSHLEPNSFQKMSVSLMTELFNTSVADGIRFYQNMDDSDRHNWTATADFIELIARIYEILTNKIPVRGLQVGSPELQELKKFQEFIVQWKRDASHRSFCIAEGTWVGMMVTLQSVMDLLSYCTSKLKMKYLLTAKLTQDILEHFFGLIRQLCGPNTNPTVKQFLYGFRLLSVYNVAKPPKFGNCPSSENARMEVLTTLEDLREKSKDTDDTLPRQIDKLLDDWILSSEIELPVETCMETNIDSGFLHNEHDYDSPAQAPFVIAYFGGYVARKALKMHDCANCSVALLAKSDDSLYTDLIQLRTKGHLLWPSNNLSNLLFFLETCIKQELSTGLSSQTPHQVWSRITSHSSCNFVGCPEHREDVTKFISKFYVTCRLHFYCRELNKNRRKRINQNKHAKLSKL